MQISLSLTASLSVQYAIFNKDGEVVISQILVPNQHRQLKINEFQTPKKFMLSDGSTKLGALAFMQTKVHKSIQSEHFHASVELLVSNKLTTGSDINSQYFIVHKNDENGEARTEEDIDSEIESIFFNKNMKKLPIPMKNQWKEFFWIFVKDSLIELDSYGDDIPYRGYHLSIPDINTLGSSIRLAQISYEFKKYHKRLPQLKSMLYISDVKGFNPKLWTKFINEEVGGIEKFKSIHFDHQVSIAQGFEIFGGMKEIFILRQELHTTSTEFLNRKMRGEKEESKKALWKRLLGKGLVRFKGSDTLVRFLENFDMLLDSKLEAMKNGHWTSIEEQLLKIRYTGIDPSLTGIKETLSELYDYDMPHLVNTCSDSGVSDAAFKVYQEEYTEGVKLALEKPRNFPLFKLTTEKLTGEFIDAVNPTALIVGRDTNCCQHFGSVGGACVRYMLRNPDTSGIFVIKESGKIIAQSFFWIVESSIVGEYILVFDSIEHLGSLRDSVRDLYKKSTEFILRNYGLQFQIKSINVGAGWNGQTKLKDLSTKNADGHFFASIPRSLSYTDANTQYVLGSMDLTQEYKSAEKVKIRTNWKES